MQYHNMNFSTSSPNFQIPLYHPPVQEFEENNQFIQPYSLLIENQLSMDAIPPINQEQSHNYHQQTKYLGIHLSISQDKKECDLNFQGSQDKGIHSTCISNNLPQEMIDLNQLNSKILKFPSENQQEVEDNEQIKVCDHKMRIFPSSQQQFTQKQNNSFSKNENLESKEQKLQSNFESQAQSQILTSIENTNEVFLNQQEQDNISQDELVESNICDPLLKEQDIDINQTNQVLPSDIPIKRGRGRPRKFPQAENLTKKASHQLDEEVKDNENEGDQQSAIKAKKKEEARQRKSYKEYLKKRSQEQKEKDELSSDNEEQSDKPKESIIEEDEFYQKILGKGNSEFLKNYKQKLIGGSSNSKIFELRDSYLDISMGEVVKEVHHKMSNHHQSECEELRNEYHFLSKINHPKIISLGSCKEFIRDRNFCGIVLPLAQDNLMQYAKNQRHGKILLSQMRSAFKQISQAIDYLHNNYISHNDIKPDNIFIFGEDDYRLADFGFSIDLPKPNSFKRNSVHSKVLRKQYKIDDLKKNWRQRCKQYVAPELIKLLNGKRPRTPSDEKSCDVFALGVSFFIIIFYQLPFCGSALKTDQRYKHIFNGNHDKFWSQFHSMFVKFNLQQDSYTEELRDLFNKILEPDPKKRFNIQQVLEHPWLNH